MIMSLTAAPKGQARCGYFLPQGLVMAFSPLTAAERRRPMIQEGSICVDENTDPHRQRGGSLQQSGPGGPGTHSRQ